MGSQFAQHEWTDHRYAESASLESRGHEDARGISMLLMIRWRGKQEVKDEPQHTLTGPRLLETLAANDLPHGELSKIMLGVRGIAARLIALGNKRRLLH